MTYNIEQKQLEKPHGGSQPEFPVGSPRQHKHALREASKQKNKWQQSIFKSGTLQQLAEVDC